jgi:YD repeat-containing protein
VKYLDPVNWSSGTYYIRDMTYDSQNRLTDADVYENGQEVQGFKYSYDAAGNRTSFTQNVPYTSVSYSYNAGNELTSQTQGNTTVTYSYDQNGNLTAVTPGGSSLDYNARNQTTSIGSNSYTYSGPDQTDRVQINSTTLDYSGLGLSRQEDSSGTTHFVRCSCGLPSHQCQKHRVKTCQY